MRAAERSRRLLEENARASSVFEGARGLKSPQPEAANRRSIASRKKSIKAA